MTSAHSQKTFALWLPAAGKENAGRTRNGRPRNGCPRNGRPKNGGTRNERTTPARLRWGAAVAVALAAVALAPGSVSTAAAASSRDGSCDAGEFCYYSEAGQQGSVSDLPGSIPDYGTDPASCYVYTAGDLKDSCIKNSAASVWNRTDETVRVYFNSNYGGQQQDVTAGTKADLFSALVRNNASHLVGDQKVYTAKDDYKYKGATSGVDEWFFYKGQCTSFVAWAIESRLGITDFSNQYKGQHFGNANTWVDAAEAAGVPVSTTPKAGDVAVRLGGSYGHVAFVTSVNSDGTFEVDEYNYNGGSAYSHRTVSVGSANSQFSHFITLT